ncbi:hypothetical protein L3Q82_003905 [Scortum barcoo]|uniref:Uncharacterized protein n=1 Tax=Scortum barcoo TaxID=214431 RepID=A0ACB8X648_9TELE|nr:hypothetical protein L3Q82_003905 [Scortum barcoo]
MTSYRGLLCRHSFPNQKPWVNGEVRAKLKARTETPTTQVIWRSTGSPGGTRSGEPSAAQRDSTGTKWSLITRAPTPGSMWAGLKTLTDYKKKISSAEVMSASLPDELNTFYARFESTSPAVEVQKAQEDHCPPVISRADVCRSFKQINTRKAPGPEGFPGRALKLQHHHVKFADDTTVIGLITGTTTRRPTERSEVRALTSWCQDNNLHLNVSKTKELIVDFRRRQREEHAPLSINGTTVERVNSFRFLGVHISEDLTWTHHTDFITKSARQRLFFLRRLRRLNMDSRILCSFYRCTIESILTGCTSPPGTAAAPPSTVKALQREMAPMMASGKRKGGGVCFMVNNKWCSDVEIISTGCSPDLEHLMIRCRPYYLPREFTSIVMTAAYVHTCRHQQGHGRAVWSYRQDRDLTAGGCVYCSRGLYSANLRKVLPRYHQHISCPTLGENTLDDHVYTPFRDKVESHYQDSNTRSLWAWSITDCSVEVMAAFLTHTLGAGGGPLSTCDIQVNPNPNQRFFRH